MGVYSVSAVIICHIDYKELETEDLEKRDSTFLNEDKGFICIISECTRALQNLSLNAILTNHSSEEEKNRALDHITFLINEWIEIFLEDPLNS